MKKTVATGLMTGLGALGAAVTDSATARTDSCSSCYGDDYSISPSSGYYWRRWQLQRPNRLLRLWLLLQQPLGRLIETRHQSVRRSLTLLVAVLAMALALSGCAGQSNAATTPVTPKHGDGGNFMQFYDQQLQQPPATNVCHPKTLELLLPCHDEEGRP
jgi:F0F1-type ATP synthase membrane subunit c/vacuolar-type H+-ATPase subunit K